MPQTQIACPRCRQPIPAQVEQLFDVTADSGAKQRLIGRVSNYARCQHCGFEGPLATPIVYHDNEKELLLTYFPPELGLPANEQEKLIGPYISQVMNRLPSEKRKGYLLRPQNCLTYQGLIEKILEKDGVTREMLDEQQKRLNVIQRLLQTSTADVRAEIIKQESKLLDETFFALFSKLMDAAVQSGQQQTAQMMNALQADLMEHSEYGRKVRAQYEELELAVKTLQEAGQGLTREKLLEIFLDAPNDDRLKALVSMTRNGLDYSFFQLMTEQMDAAQGEKRTQLEDLRNKVLDFTNQIDKVMEEQMKQAGAFIEQILSAPDLTQAVLDNMEQFNNEAVSQVFEMKLHEASKNKDNARIQKLQQVISILQQASTPPEMQIIQEMIEAPDETGMTVVLQNYKDQVSPEMSGMIGSLMAQVEQQAAQNPDAAALLQKLEMAYRVVLKFQMSKSVA